MELPPNALKRAFREGRPQIGLWSQLTSPVAAEILSHSGFDFLVIDTEHAPNELPHVLAQLQVLLLQLERMNAGFIPSLREYYRVFGVTLERLERAPRELLTLHPGPMNRGVEIDSRVADGPHSVILHQVTNGGAIRMAVLYLLAGGRLELAESAKRVREGAE